MIHFEKDILKYKCENKKEGDEMKKIISIILMWCVLISGFAVPTVAKENDFLSGADAGVVFEKNIRKHNVLSACMATNRDITVNEKNGRRGWLLKSASTASATLYIDLSDSYVKEVSDGSAFRIEVDYLDANNGVFSLLYDSQDWEQKEGVVTYVANTNEWKTAVYEIDDAYFGNRLNGAYDLGITVRSKKITTSRGDVTIGAVRVYRQAGKYPIRVSSVKSDIAGNIFGNGEEKKFKVNLVNNTDSARNVFVDYAALDASNTVVWSKTDELNVPTEGLSDIPVTVDADKYGLYKISVTVRDESFSHNEIQDFSYINNRTDGRKNYKFGYAAHLDSGYSIDDVCGLIAKSGAGMVRGGFARWWYVDPADKPKYRYNRYEQLDEMLAAIKKYGFQVVALLGLYGPSKYDGLLGATSIPITEDALKGYEGFCRYVAQLYKSEGIKVLAYELWNEIDLKGFNVNGTPYQAGVMARRGAKAVLDVDPNAKIGLSDCMGPYNDNIYAQQLDGGYGEYANDLTVHMYDFDRATEDGIGEKWVNEFKRIYKEKTGKDIRSVNHTEYGRSTASLVSKNYRDVAKYCIRDNVYWFGRGVWDSISWYNFVRKGEIDNYKESTYGHLQSYQENVDTTPLAATEVYVAETNYNTLLMDTGLADKLIDGEDDKYVYIFKKSTDEKPVMAVWAKDTTKMLSFKSKTKEVTVYDMYGNSEKVYGKDGVFSLLINGEMQYIQGDIADAEITDNPIEFEDYAYSAANGSIISIHTTKAPNGLTAEIQEGLGVKYVAGAGDVNENTRVKVSLPNTPDVLTEVYLRMKDKDTGKTAFAYRFPVKVTEAITIKMSALPKSIEDISHWNIHTEITNQRTGKPIKGTISVTNPAEWVNSIKDVEFDTIPELSTGIVEFDSAKMSRLDSKLVTINVKSDLGDEYELSQLIDFAVAAFVDKPPTIDGVLSDGEWYYSTAVYAETADAYVGNGPWNGKDDVSGKMMLQCDEKNLYLAADVTDDVMYTPENGTLIWKNDSIQFGIAFEIKDIEQFYGGDFTQIAIADSPNGPTVYRHISEKNQKPEGVVESAKLAVRRDGNHTYYELEIPWSEITQDEISADSLTKIGFSMLINDNDGSGRKGAIQYGGGIYSTKDIGRFKFLNVMKAK